MLIILITFSATIHVIRFPWSDPVIRHYILHCTTNFAVIASLHSLLKTRQLCVRTMKDNSFNPACCMVRPVSRNNYENKIEIEMQVKYTHGKRNA